MASEDEESLKSSPRPARQITGEEHSTTFWGVDFDLTDRSPDAALMPEHPDTPHVMKKSRCDLPVMPRNTSFFEQDGEEDCNSAVSLRVLRVLAVLLSCCVGPIWCRTSAAEPPTRCGVVILSVLALNICQVMPLYCIALFIPVLGTLCEALGSQETMRTTSTLFIGQIFNNTSFLVLGALVINGIFAKCDVEKRFMKMLLVQYRLESSCFLLVLMYGTMAMCSVMYSGSIMLLAAIKPFIRDAPAPVAKRLMLGIAFASNLGSTWLPISSPVNLIAISLLGEFDEEISLYEWVLIAIPVSSLILVGSWMTLCVFFPNTQTLSSRSPREWQEARRETEAIPIVELTRTHALFLGIALSAIMCITIIPDELEPIVGHPACLSIAIVVITFGSGFMNRAEFVSLDWDLLALVGGTNVMAFLVRETGLGAVVAAYVVSFDFLTVLPFWGLLVLLVCGTVAFSGLVGHTMTGVILLPLMVSLGVKLMAAETTTILIAIAIPTGMGMIHSSFDNLAAHTVSMQLEKRKSQLKQTDFIKAGSVTAIISMLVVLSVGFGIGVALFGSPPPVVIAETGTPKDLKPKVVKENINVLPAESNQVTWNEKVPDWETFQGRPDYKAFAVGKLEKGMKTRNWSAVWGYSTQQQANTAAVRECENQGTACRLIWNGKPVTPPADIVVDDPISHRTVQKVQKQLIQEGSHGGRPLRLRSLGAHHLFAQEQ